MLNQPEKVKKKMNQQIEGYQFTTNSAKRHEKLIRLQEIFFGVLKIPD
jgi:hypothetical protein